ncbi:hypothetical protein [Kineococcus rubinsiae]|uniref:hypothetical protein n=1 Tax=Kineococcus rubinsiae TaxID=2609562 RepID=UPI0014306EFD|nr:hypothetical protein [Kineococcus rubinsiae]NIZ90041.1 hypothetical protein [Kineococcus rubinsiae]
MAALPAEILAAPLWTFTTQSLAAGVATALYGERVPVLMQLLTRLAEEQRGRSALRRARPAWQGDRVDDAPLVVASDDVVKIAKRR